MIAPALPVEAVVPELLAALERAGRAVLVAPPGAGKTTRVPLAMLEAGTPGRILVLEPRRLAARAAAERMAASLGERAGGRVGYRMRGAAAVSAATRIEVVTEGILTRMLQDDPSLPGVGAIVFDEFHERSIAADLGLAFALEARAALRPDLRLLVMSATLEAAPVAALMGGAPVVRAEGRAFPVETLWAAAPMGAGFEAEVAAAVRRRWPGTRATCSCSFPAKRRSAAWRGSSQASTARFGRSTARCRSTFSGPRSHRPKPARSCSQRPSPRPL